jgi:hypothetical protein
MPHTLIGLVRTGRWHKVIFENGKSVVARRDCRLHRCDVIERVSDVGCVLVLVCAQGAGLVEQALALPRSAMVCS